MIIGIFSIILACLAILACFAVGAISLIGVCLSLTALVLACFSTIGGGQKKHLFRVFIIVSFNIFIVSELSFALNKNLYSDGETPLRKIIHIVTYHEDGSIKAEKLRRELEDYFYILKVRLL